MPAGTRPRRRFWSVVALQRTANHLRGRRRPGFDLGDARYDRAYQFVESGAKGLVELAVKRRGRAY